MGGAACVYCIRVCVCPTPHSLQELAGDFLKLVELVETTVDLDKAEAHEFVIKSSFDEGLQRE